MKGGGKILDVVGQEGWGILKCGRHMCIVPNLNLVSVCLIHIVN